MLKTPNPWTGTTTYAENGRVINGWDFHDTFFVTLKASKLIAIGAEDPVTHQLNPGWVIQPDLLGLHNSPAKPCPPVPPGPTTLQVTNKATSGKTVSITIKNTGTQDAILNQLALSWPQVPNGNLTTIKLDGDTLYSNNTGVASPQTLGVPPLTATVSKRTVEAGQTEVLVLTFKNNVDTNLTHYTGTASWDNGTPNLTLLP